jgi:DNA-binding IclR family transcriptional regulator
MFPPMTDAPPRQTAPQSVTRVIRILELLCARAEPVSLADLARLLATPKSSLAALLRGLAEEGFVVASDGAWQLGPGAFGLGSALLEARRRTSSPELVRQGMRRLAEASGETVLLALRDTPSQPNTGGATDTITYVDVIESRNSVRFAVSVGDRRPLYLTAGGRALLSADADEAVRAYLDRLQPEKRTPQGETGKQALAQAIAAARAAGVAQTVDQAADGVTGTAALIRDAAGRVLGALVVAAPSARSQGRLAELRRLVSAEARTISRSLGHRPTD